MDVYTERTLLISGSEKGLDAIINFLKGCGYAAVSVVSSGDEARRMLQQDTFSLIVLNTPLKDEFGYQLSLQLTQNTCSGVVMLCKADMAEEMANKTISYGVLVVAKPLNRAALLQAIRMGKAMHGRMMHMKAENDKLQKKLEELRCVSRAKCILNGNNTRKSRHTVTLKNWQWIPAGIGEKLQWKFCPGMLGHK